MTLYGLKPRFQALLRPGVQAMAGAGVTANAVTLLAATGSLVVAAIVAWAAARGAYAAFLLIPLWLALRMALNAVDGMLAREHGQASPLGAYLNELADVISDAALYAPFALAPSFGPVGIGLFILLSALSEYAGALGPMIGAPRQYQGPLGKSDRALLFGALGALVALFGPLPPIVGWIVPLACVLLAFTIVNRVRAGLAATSSSVNQIAPVLASDENVPVSSEPVAQRPVREERAVMSDGTELVYRHWPTENPKGAIVLLHRGHEHSGRVAHLADELDLPDFDIFAWDARGHGLSPGPRGHSPSFGRSVRDLDDFVGHVTTRHGFPLRDIAVIAQSVGAALAAAWVHDYAPDIRALVLASPAFSVRLYVPFARPGLALLQKLRGDFTVNSYVKPGLLTHDAERAASFRTDPLITRAIAVNVLLGLYDTSERVVADARAITVPVQLLVSGADWVVRQAPQHLFYERLGSVCKERHVLEGFYHDTLGEKERARAIAPVRRFLLARFGEAAAERPSMLDADRRGYTRDEADRLATPHPPNSLQGMRWRATKASLALGSHLSEGVRLGHKTGFDSGSTLDYVYRNEARGLGPLGRLVDRFYLDSPGWSGIRVRKLHVEELLDAAATRLRTQGAPVVILDIAAGHGRYVLDALAGWPTPPDSVLLRDYLDLNVAAGQALIRSRNLQDFVHFEQGDAFDRVSLASVRPRPTLAVVSGLYELFADNALVGRSLAGLAEAIPAGGFLVYTNQPWHPQLEFIARALTSHRQGDAWVMRRRTQQEMDELVTAAGFRKITQRIDEAGIFTVSLAERLP